MKPSACFLLVSLAANGVLVGALVFGGRPSARNEPSAILTLPAVTAPSSGAPVAPGEERKSPASSRTLEASHSWSRLYSEDLDELAGRLRAAGFPFKAVRSILSALIRERSLAQRTALLGQRDVPPYWQPLSYGSQDRELQTELARLMVAEQKLYRKFFRGPDAIRDDEDMAAQARMRYGDLPLEKLQQLARIEEDYSDLSQAIYLSGQGLTAADRENLALIEREHRRDIQAALTPEEFEHFQLRNGPTASSLRTRLDAFQPSEDEFKTLVALHRSVEERFPINSPRDPAIVAARTQALEDLNPQIEAALGPGRYADYQQTLLESSQKVNNLLARIGLPLATGGRIEAMRQEITQRAEAVRSDPQLTSAERQARLGALAQEAQDKVTETLGGPRNYAAYEDIKGWIRDLRPKPTP